MTHLAFVLAALVLSAVLWRRARTGGAASQALWRDLAFAAICGFVATTIKALAPAEIGHQGWLVAGTGVDAIAYAFVAMAAGRQPYQVSPWQVPRLEDRWMRPGVIITVACAWCYVVLIPIVGVANGRPTPTQVDGLFVALAAYAVVRLIAEARGAQRAGDAHWRRVFGWLAAASFTWFGSRVIYAFLPSEVFPFSTLWTMLLTAAAGVGLITASLIRDPAPPQTAPELWTSPRAIPVRTTLHTAIFALAFPIGHIVLHAVTDMPAALRGDRERLVLAALMLLGSLALVQRTLLRRRAAALTAEHRRIESMIRQHQTNLDLGEARRTAMTSIRDVADRFERIFRACPSLMAIVGAHDGTILHVNESFERITGVSRCDAVGQPAGAFGLWPSASDAPPWIEAVRRGATIRDHRLTLTDRAGDVHALRVSGASVALEHGDGYVLLGRDVTEREERLRDTTRVARWLEQASVPMVVVDGENRLTLASRGASRLVGPLFDSARGDDVGPLLGNADAAAWRRVLVRARASGHGLALLNARSATDDMAVACRFATVSDEREERHVLLVITPLPEASEPAA